MAWQRLNGVQRVPRKYSDDCEERKLALRFGKLLLRRDKALGTEPSRLSYRHLKWLWSIQCRVYLFMDARQQLPAAAAWLNTFLNLLPYKDHAMRLPIV